jgi:hypothetical protein
MFVYNIEMKMRNILYVLTLMAYSLSLAHSVIPHHHHKTADEAAAHNHQDDHHHDHTPGLHHDKDENKPDKKSNSTGHFFFFSHEINADVLVKDISVKTPVKTKKAQISVPVKEKVFSFVVSAHLVFHPPQDDPLPRDNYFCSRIPRAPPQLLS